MTTTANPPVEGSGKRRSPAAVTTCPACGSTESWGMASWCPTCGFYPALMKGSAERRRVAEAAAPPVEQFDVKEAVPEWVWVLVAGVVMVIVFSFVISAMLPETGPERAFFALGQCLLAFFAALTGHISAFLYAASKSDKFAPLDAIMKPVEIWKPTFSALPKASWRVWTAGWGLTAILCGVFIVGGLRYEALFEDWGAEKRASVNIVQEVVDRAKKERDGAGSLEDAMNDFVGEDEAKKKEDISKWPTVDCLVVAYVNDDKGELDSILVASLVRTDLTYVGRVPVADIADESRDKLLQRMTGLRRRSPFVKVTGEVVETDKKIVWLEPVLMCQVAYKDWDNGHKLTKPHVKTMLHDVEESK